MNTAPIDLSQYNLARPAGAMAVQQILRNARSASGNRFYAGNIDGDFGPLSQDALAAYEEENSLHQGKVFLGSNGYRFNTYVDGDDYCADGIPATCFGGPEDPQDDGTCASGFVQRNHPDTLICSLPMSYDRDCHGSPWGHFLGWDTEVQISAMPVGSPVFSSLLKDVGPNHDTDADNADGSANGVDCGETLARMLSGNPAHFDGNHFKMLVRVRVIGGAKKIMAQTASA